MILNEVLLNKESYKIGYAIYKIDQSGDPSPQKHQLYQDLFYQCVMKFEFVSEFNNPILTGTLIYKDMSMKIFPELFADNRTFIDVTLIKVNPSNGNNTEFRHSFIVSSIKMVEKGDNYGIYKLGLLSIDWIKFNNHLAYSSFTEKTYSRMIREMMVKSEIPINPSFREFGNLGSFITPANHTLIQSIMHLLKYAMNIDDGVGLIFLDHINGWYTVDSAKRMYANVAESIDIDNILGFPCKSQTFDQQRTINGLEEEKYIPMTSDMEITKPVNIYKFSYDDRSWNKISYNRNITNSSFPKYDGYNVPLNSLAKIIPEDVRKESNNMLSVENNNYNNARALLLFSDVINFKCYGVIKRGSGQFVNLMVPIDNEFYRKYNGPWLIERVYHTIEIDGKYLNSVQACRLQEKVK